MSKIRAAVFAALFFPGLAGPAGAQDVTLTSHDGTVEVSGTLQGFDGEFYRVDTIYGVLTVDGSGVSCEGPGCPDLESYVAELSVSGAQTMGDVLMPALIEAFAERNGMDVRRVIRSDTDFTYVLRQPDNGPDLARIRFHLSSTEEGFADLLADDADMVLALRELRPVEAARAKEAGLGDLTRAARSRIVGLDGLVAVVAPDNPLDGISLEMLARIFSGETGNWRDLGGPDAAISVHMRRENSGLTQNFMDEVMRPAKLELATGIVLHDSTAELVDAVAADPFAIGIGSYSETGNAKSLAMRGDCGFSFQATTVNLKTEDYPMTAPLFLYTPARRLPKVGRDFMAFLRSPTAQLVVRRSGFVDQRPVEISLKAQGARLANAITAAGTETSLKDLQKMVAVLQTARRLTVTFRFQAGSTRLDAQSQANVVHLARLLESGVYDGRRLIFIGFSDGDGGAAANLRISRKRAAAARAAVLKEAATADLSRLTLDIDAFGEALPMACDNESWGRRANRRVEVWVR